MLCLPFPVSRFPLCTPWRPCHPWHPCHPCRAFDNARAIATPSHGAASMRPAGFAWGGREERPAPPFSLEISAAVCSGCGSALYTCIQNPEYCHRLEGGCSTSAHACTSMYGKSHDLAMWVIPTGAKARHATGSLRRRLSLSLRPAPRAASHSGSCTACAADTQ